MSCPSIPPWISEPRKLLARYADKNGAAKFHELAQSRDHVDVLARGLSECNSRIKDNTRLRNSGLVRERD